MTIEYLAIAIAVISLFWLGYLEYRLRAFFKSKNGESLESIIRAIITELETMQDMHDEHGDKIEQIHLRLRRAVQGVNTVRFNPFREVGGKQSFATALLNEQGDGVVISTLYSRDRTSVFAKPIKQFASEYELTPEEEQAMKGAASAPQQ